jgi:hypothetical protein
MYGGERGIWTLAPVTRPTPLAGAPLQPLEYFPKIKMAPQVGLEPTTDRLTADCSTTELLRNNILIYIICLASTPSFSAASIHSRKSKTGIWDLLSTVFQSWAVAYTFHIMVGLNGLEPSTSRLSGVRSNQLSYRPIIFWSGWNPVHVNHFTTTAIIILQGY